MSQNTEKIHGFPGGLLTFAVIITFASIAWITWNFYQLYKFSEHIKSEHLRAEELRGTILHFDEVRTMAARMAAATGDSIWEKRYYQVEPQLDSAIKEITRLAPHLHSKKKAAELNDANVALVRIEYQALTLVSIGQALEAQDLLFGEKYTAHKKDYSSWIAKFIKRLREDLDSRLETQRKNLVLAGITAGFAFLVLLFTWFIFIKNLRNWRKYILNHIMERMRAEEALGRAKSMLEEQNIELRKVDRIKDALICDVTHELKTPVAKYAMQMDILSRILKKHKLVKETKKVLNVMDSTLKRQEGVLRNVLDLSRLESGRRTYKTESVSLGRLVQEVLDDYASTLETNKVEVKKDLNPISINTDREMIFHVISNLINNAIKYRNAKKKPFVRVSVSQKDGTALIAVADNGLGLTEEQAGRIFERFYQATASAEGSGVGLAICKKIIDDLGHKIWAESPGIEKGSTFFIEF
jgi:signal transduction histidine kinase